MSGINLLENMDREQLRWFCEPPEWRLEDSKLAIAPEAKTDFWQRTHYGFSADNGHFLWLELPGNFTISTRVRFFAVNQYDQAGLMVRASSDCWLKSSVEFEPNGPCRLGAVVTNQGYSDWSTQDFPVDENELELRIRREGDDFTVEYLTAARMGWTQIRMAHLQLDGKPVQAGVYACSPIGAGFRAEFDYLSIE